MAATGVADVCADVEVAGVAGREAGAEDLRSSRIHAEQGVFGVQVCVVGAEIAPHRGQAVAFAADDDFGGIDRCHGAVERVTGHRPGEVAGQIATGGEDVGLGVRVVPPIQRIAELVVHYLGEVVPVELIGRLPQRRRLNVLVDEVRVDSERAVPETACYLLSRDLVLGGKFLHPRPGGVEPIDRAGPIERLAVAWVSADIGWTVRWHESRHIDARARGRGFVRPVNRRSRCRAGLPTIGVGHA
ncbi:hypothetical protein [Nocardia transvalensis]|uniref:hypothetical protein n=1 Tax=Nocardia transvalensis TaxID=37333 RepID=UPI001E4A6CAE|nr:hypothetical protein [Nocardia transvalensis]